MSSNHQEEHDESYLVFRIGSEKYAAQLLAVREVVEYKTPKAIPNTKSYFMGVINIRGEIVGVIDLSDKLGFGKNSMKQNIFIVVGTPQGAIASAVDEVLSVQKIEASQIDTLSKARSSGEYFVGVAKSGDHIFTLLDLAKVISEIEVAEINSIKINVA